MSSSALRVEWAEPAVADLVALVRFIARDAPVNARKVLDRLRQKAASLDTTPLRGRIVPELEELGLQEYRELLSKPYRIIYRVGQDRVLVLAVLDGRRRLEDVLYERLVRGS